MSNEFGYEYEWDSRYCYPNSFVLKNKFNITDEKKLQIAEREHTALAIAEIKVKPIRGDFNLKHLQEIHKAIFKDVYDWAGEIRNVNIIKGNMFCNYMFISEVAESIFTKLRNEKYLIGTDKIHERLAYYLSEINTLHPFREGNGRAQRIFIESLAQVAGYKVDFSDVSKEEMIEACIASFKCDYRKMENIFKKITKPISIIQQKKHIEQIATKNSPVLEIYNSMKIFLKKKANQKEKEVDR